MKFGHNLYRNVVPEWSSYYLDYKALKKGINRIQASSGTQEADVAPFLFALDRELEKVDEFYNKRLAESLRRLKLLDAKFGQRLGSLVALDRDEIGEIVGVLLELRSQLRKVIWFGDVNRRGFVKILKKYSTRLAFLLWYNETCITFELIYLLRFGRWLFSFEVRLDKRLRLTVKESYLCSKVNERPFASSVDVTAAERRVNDWLGKIEDGTELNFKDDSNLVGAISQIRVSPGAVAGLPVSSVNMVDTAISNDDQAAIQRALETIDRSDRKTFSRIILNLLQRAVTSMALSCIDLLLPCVDALSEDDDINERNILHRLIISLGRKIPINRTASIEPAVASYMSTESSVPLSSDHYFFTDHSTPMVSDLGDPDAQLSKDNAVVRIFAYLLSRLQDQQRLALTSPDCYGRIPLHYAAQYGFAILCEIIIEHMHLWGQLQGSERLLIENYRDDEGFTPLHLAVLGNHHGTAELLLGTCDTSQGCPTSKTPSALTMATKINSPALIRLLLTAGLAVNLPDENGETALHVAARLGYVECAQALLEGGKKDQRIDIELSEGTFGWTPLFIAAVDGHIDIVNLLLDAGADFRKSDLSGWTAQEHAALRGHLDIARKLCHLSNASHNLAKGSDQSKISTDQRTLTAAASEQSDPKLNFAKQPLPVTEPVKSFGHRYLQTKTLILVSLGSKDTRKQFNPVQLERIPIRHAHAVQLGNALSLVVSAENASGEKTIIDLPIQENISTEPISFETDDITKVRLLFDLIPTYSGNDGGKIGRAVAILSSLKPGVGHGKVSLQGGVQVPLLGANSLEVMGCINFEFLVITPFTHKNMSITKNQTYWKSLSSPRVIGHRGLGKNLPSRQSLQLGENTLQSFISAANLGASYVEFDVQLTKDYVPVLYHDFLVGETGIDAPVHDLTLEQFLHISERQTPKSSRAGTPDGTTGRRTPTGLGLQQQQLQQQRRPRSLSLTPLDYQEQEINEKMKYTRAFKLKGFKGNTRGSSIQGPIQTLANVFKDLPETIGFNIELKYPMLQESEMEEMDTFGIEMNFWVDTILSVVYDHVKGRDLIFSSFNPDICLMLSFKQPSIPVLFLTEAGTEEMADIRACCLKEAIKFASRWNLLGIVSAAEPLILCPRLVKAVKESGLVCVTYGVLNNDTQNVKLQVEQGVDAVIVDSVLAIRKGLTNM